MVTKNFKKIMAYVLSRTDCGGGSSRYTPTLTDINNDDYMSIQTNRIEASFGFPRSNPFSETGNSVSYMGVKVGTGTTEATEDDYELENVNSDITVDDLQQTVTSKILKQYIMTLTNTTESDIDISEVGLYVRAYSQYHSGWNTLTFLLDRTVLSSSITIPAGTSKTLVYEIGF